MLFGAVFSALSLADVLQRGRYKRYLRVSANYIQVGVDEATPQWRLQLADVASVEVHDWILRRENTSYHVNSGPKEAWNLRVKDTLGVTREVTVRGHTCGEVNEVVSFLRSAMARAEDLGDAEDVPHKLRSAQRAAAKLSS
jgi:hypothetical protein